jgi:hypothetical protein
MKKTVILAAIVALSLGAGVANAQTTARSAGYHTPAHNFYQNNWMSGE